MIRLQSPEGYEYAVQQAGKKVEVDVDMIHIKNHTARILQRNRVMEVIGPMPVKVIIFLPHFAIIIAHQRLIAPPVGIEEYLMVDQRPVIPRIISLLRND